MKYCLVSLSVLYLIVMFSLIGVGCTPTTLPSLTATRDSMTPLNSMPTTLPTPTQTITPINSTPSVTPFPTEKSETFTPTPPTSQPTNTETPLPIPTAPGTSVTEQVLWLFETNNGCQLPCWWGITPGQTTWDVANQFFGSFISNIDSVSNSQATNYSPIIPLPPELFGEVEYMSPVYNVREGIVHSIRTGVAIVSPIPAGYLEQYKLSQFLVAYGKPLEIWLFTYSSSFEEGDLPFIVVLFYPQRGIIALYSDNGIEQGNMIQGCPQRDPVSQLMLREPESDLTFEQIVNNSSVFDRDYLSLNVATGMDVSTFYETFKNPDNTVCLETPANLWEP